jgi:primosomal protein N'
MNILTIIPIAKGIPRDELSYFSAKSVTLGTLVTVPFGNRSIKGVVIDQQPVRDLKSTIKTSSFVLRNITTIHHDQALPAVLFSAGQKTARFFAQPVGPVIKTMIPDMLFDYYIEHPILLEKKPSSPNIQTIQTSTSERISMYKTIIRENLAKQQSTMVVVPSIVHAEHHAKELGFGIDDSIVIMHSKKTKKQVAKNLEQIFDVKKPIVLITTPPYASIIRNDWDTIIIEESGSSYYHYTFSPVFDMRLFIETLGTSFGSRVIFGDILLDPQTRLKITERQAIEMRNMWHIQKPERFDMIDMKPTSGISKSFAILDPEIVTILEQAQEKKLSAVLMTSRKGLAPLTICGDCNAVVSCPVCDTPLVLHKKKTKESTSRIYMCHACLHMTPPMDQCQVCTSWKLNTFGITTDTIAETLEKKFPKTKIFICDGDTTKTPAAIKKIITQWEQQAGSLLVITPPITAYLKTIPVGCIVSLDSLISLPTIDGQYHALRTTLSFLEKIEMLARIQTRSIQHTVMQTLHHETLQDWMHSDMESRKQFLYPPCHVLLKVSVSVVPDQAKPASDYFDDIFKNYEPDILMKKSSSLGEILVTAIIKIDRDVWNNMESEIQHVVRGLGEGFVCEVNPERVV